MFDGMAEFNWAVFNFVAFAIIIVVGMSLVFRFASGIVQGIFHVIVSRTKPPGLEEKCAYCPRPRRKGHVSCSKCGKPL